VIEMDLEGNYRELLLQADLEGCSNAVRTGNKYFIGSPYDSAFLVCDL